jgi:DNA replication licensing factor MCM2
MRKESSVVGGIPIAVRHIESVLRMAEAHAKMHLREYVRSDDIDIAIKIMMESFLQSQKFSISKNLRRKFVHYLTQQEDHQSLLFNVLNRMMKEQVSLIF